MTSKESTLLAQMQDLGYNHGIIITALKILGQSKTAQDDTLLYLYDKKPSEKAFIEHIAEICDGNNLEGGLS